MGCGIRHTFLGNKKPIVSHDHRLAVEYCEMFNQIQSGDDRYSCFGTALHWTLKLLPLPLAWLPLQPEIVERIVLRPSIEL